MFELCGSFFELLKAVYRCHHIRGVTIGKLCLRVELAAALYLILLFLFILIIFLFVVQYPFTYFGWKRDIQRLSGRLKQIGGH